MDELFALGTRRLHDEHTIPSTRSDLDLNIIIHSKARCFFHSCSILNYADDFVALLHPGRGKYPARANGLNVDFWKSINFPEQASEADASTP